MTNFKDSGGRAWPVAVTVWGCKRVKSLTGVDLYKLIGDELKPLGELLNDPGTFCDVLFVLCEDEAKRSGVTDEQFGRALAGDSFHAAQEAFVAALVDFFPNPKARAALTKALNAARALMEAEMDRATAELDRIGSSGPSGNSPGPSGSTPTP